MRVATFNVHHCASRDGRVDVERVASAIASLEADLVALQELDHHQPRSGDVDQPAVLSRALGREVFFFPTLRRNEGEYGLGLIAEGAEQLRYASLPQVGEAEPRGVITCRWRGITILATHLARDEASRRLQTVHLAEVGADAPPPVLLLGDLNQSRRSLAPLVAAGFHVPRARRPTVRLSQIDHILPGPGLTLQALWTAAPGVSDHLALVGELEAL
jgi:endonuclease/exonuclease/phosphatase family metal-dependent hydrolase